MWRLKRGCKQVYPFFFYLCFLSLWWIIVKKKTSIKDWWWRERERGHRQVGRKSGYGSTACGCKLRLGATWSGPKCSWASGRDTALRALLWFVIMWFFFCGASVWCAPTLRLFLAGEYWVAEQREGGAWVTVNYFCSTKNEQTRLEIH